MKTTIDKMTGARSDDVSGKSGLTVSRFAAIVAGGLALGLVGCGDREREVSAYDTAEQEDATIQYEEETRVTADQPLQPAPAASATTSTSVEAPEAVDTTESQTYAAETQQAVQEEELDVSATEDTTYAASAEADQPAPSGEQSAQQDQTGEQDLEQRIREDLRMAENLNLSEEELNQIEIQAQQGRVTLAGSVPSQQVADQIEQEVNQLDEVQSVDNQLQVQGQMQQVAE